VGFTILVSVDDPPGSHGAGMLKYEAFLGASHQWAGSELPLRVHFGAAPAHESLNSEKCSLGKAQLGSEGDLFDFRFEDDGAALKLVICRVDTGNFSPQEGGILQSLNHFGHRLPTGLSARSLCGHTTFQTEIPWCVAFSGETSTVTTTLQQLNIATQPREQHGLFFHTLDASVDALALVSKKWLAVTSGLTLKREALIETWPEARVLFEHHSTSELQNTPVGGPPWRKTLVPQTSDAPTGAATVLTTKEVLNSKGLLIKLRFIVEDLDSNSFPMVRLRCPPNVPGGMSSSELQGGIMCGIFNAIGENRHGTPLGRVSSSNQMYNLVMLDDGAIIDSGNSTAVLGDIQIMDVIEYQIYDSGRSICFKVIQHKAEVWSEVPQEGNNWSSEHCLRFGKSVDEPRISYAWAVPPEKRMKQSKGKVIIHAWENKPVSYEHCRIDEGVSEFEWDPTIDAYLWQW